MKAAYVIESLNILGGVEKMMVGKMNYLAEQANYDVTLIEVYDIEGVQRLPLSDRVHRISLGIRKSKSKVMKPVQFIKVAREVEKAIAEVKTDVMICGTLLGIIVYGLGRYSCRTIYESHGPRHFMPLKGLLRRTEKRVDRIVTLTHGDAEEYRKAGVKDDKVVVIPNFIDDSYFNGDLNSSLSTLHSPLKTTVSAIGRFSSEKGYDLLLRSWKRVVEAIPEARLQLFGDGPEREHLVALVKDLQLGSSVSVNAPTDDIMSVYRQSRAVVIPSQFEGFSLVIIEALACGTPAIAANVPYGPREILSEGRGGMLVERTEEALAEAIKNVITDDALHDRLSEEGPSVAQKYRRQTIMEQWKRVFEAKKILLLGNPSTLHSVLAKGLRERGHEVLLISPGLGWRKFPIYGTLLERRQDINPKLAFIIYLWQTLKVAHKCKGFDIVQLCNPLFFEHRVTVLKYFYDYIRRHNNKMILGAFSADFYYVDQILNHQLLRYSEQNIGKTMRNDEQAELQKYLWMDTPESILGGAQGRFAKFVADDCDAVIACLYEYWAAYDAVMPEKTSFIALPIEIPEHVPTDFTVGDKLRIFIGIQKDRSQVKGTDVMLRAAQDVVAKYSERATLQVAESVPFTEYMKMLYNSDVILDQLYSYTPSMNPLQAMIRGMVAVSGGEPENYEIINETQLHPIINVQPTYESVYEELEKLILHPERLPELKRQSVEYVLKHHDYRKVTQQYEETYLRLLGD